MIQNSISGVLDDVVKVTANNLKLYTALHEAVYSNQSSVKTQVYLENGEARDIEIPCLGYIKSRVDRIDSTLEMLTNATGNSIVRMSDGSYRRLYINKLDIPQSTSQVAGSSNTYEREKSIINMMESNVTINIPINIYNNEDTVELRVFAYKGKASDLSLSNSVVLTSNELKQAFESLKENNAIDDYADYKVLQKLEPDDMTSYGSIFVLRCVDSESIDADDNVEHKKIYYISDISFRGKEGSIYPISQGDVLTLYSSNGYHDTRVRVDVIDKTKSFIKVSYVDGYQPITIGSQLYPYVDSNKSSATIKFPVSSRFQYWIYPTLITKSGYRHEEGKCIRVDGKGDSNIKDVLDLGKYIDKYKYDEYKTLEDWRDANISESSLTPSIESSDVSFTIVNVSKDISTTSYNKIAQLEAQKKSIENSIEYYRDRVNVLHNLIISGSTVGTKAENELVQVTQSLEDSQNEFNTIVFNIADELKSNALNSKYEIHGIINMPANISKYGFECIGIEVRYRFVGNDSDTQTKSYYTLNGSKIPFDAWKYAPSYFRSRVLDTNTNKYIWSSNTTTQTSITIPIEERYNTIISYRYVFEAGYPENPKRSNWSDDITVYWDSSLENSSLTALQTINQADQVKASVNNTLSSNGVLRHIENSFTANDTYFAHTAEEIASGWVNDNQTPISLYEKLKDIMTVSQQITDSFNAVDINNFTFTLIDSDGTEQEIQAGANTINTISYMNMLKNANGKVILDVNENADYIGRAQYMLRIKAKSKYVRFTLLNTNSGITNMKSFVEVTDNNSDTNYSNSDKIDSTAKFKIVSTTGVDFKTSTDKNGKTINNSKGNNCGCAFILEDDAKYLWYDSKAKTSLLFADETVLDVPITLMVAPVYSSTTSISSTPIQNTIDIVARVGSYINAMDLTITLNFNTPVS